MGQNVLYYPTPAALNQPNVFTGENTFEGETIIDDLVLPNAAGTWTVVATNLTTAGGTPVLTGKYIKIGTLVCFSITISPGSGTSTTSTANSTTLSLPFTPVADSTISVSDHVTTNLGVGGIQNGDAVCWTPTWSTDSHIVIISGFFFTAS